MYSSSVYVIIPWEELKVLTTSLSSSDSSLKFRLML